MSHHMNGCMFKHFYISRLLVVDVHVHIAMSTSPLFEEQYQHEVFFFYIFSSSFFFFSFSTQMPLVLWHLSFRPRLGNPL